MSKSPDEIPPQESAIHDRISDLPTSWEGGGLGHRTKTDHPLPEVDEILSSIDALAPSSQLRLLEHLYHRLRSCEWIYYGGEGYNVEKTSHLEHRPRNNIKKAYAWAKLRQWLASCGPNPGPEAVAGLAESRANTVFRKMDQILAGLAISEERFFCLICHAALWGGPKVSTWCVGLLKRLPASKLKNAWEWALKQGSAKELASRKARLDKLRPLGLPSASAAPSLE